MAGSVRIAFVSCFSPRIVKKAPVWRWIQDARPDHLLLLGDAIYLDVSADSVVPPQDLDTMAFAQRLHALYGETLSDPGFAALVGQMPAGHVHSIWDDHDFLWNDAEGAEVAKNPVQADKIPLSTAFHEAFRRALASGLAPGSFPADVSDAAFWTRPQPPLATPSVALADDVLLHLTDGRTWRTRTWLVPDEQRAMLGRNQLNSLRKRVEAAPADAVHLVAAGSTLAGWQKYPRDFGVLQDLAAGHRTLVLSGDIHRNNLDAFGTAGFPLHEATSSGAAIRAAVALGPARHNHGLVDVSADHAEVRLYKKNALEYQRRLSRASWLPV